MTMHARTFSEGGGSKDDLEQHFYEGTSLRYGTGGAGRGENAMIAKFASTEEIHVVVAGETGGRFSVAIPGWLGTRNGSRPLTRPAEHID